MEVALPFVTTRWTPEEILGQAVKLGFRDGSTVDVSPDSVEGKALRTAAAALVDRNPGS